MRAIIIRELSDRLRSAQFLMLFGTGTLLFGFAGYTASERYEASSLRYSRETTRAALHPSTVSTSLCARPSALALVASGEDRAGPPGYRLQPGGQLTLSAGAEQADRLPEVAEPDFAFLVKVVFSLYVILLAYDTVAGEKEKGTLRLVLAHPVGRLRLIAGKYAAV